VVVEDALVPNGTYDNNVLEVTVSSSGEGCSKLDEHPTTVVLGRHNQHRVGCKHGVEVLVRELGGDFGQ
jgi:hypothetical protein